jgi:hypothetical protein
MVDSATPASVKVRAADSVLDHSTKAIELEDFEARLAELERAADVSKDGRRQPAMHATLMRRIERLEERSGAGRGKPRKVLRIMVTCLGREPGLENAECRRTLCPDGTLLEVVRLDRSRPGRERLSEEDPDRFVESFPVRSLV